MEINYCAVISIKLYEKTEELIKLIIDSKNIFEFHIFGTTYPAIIVNNSNVLGNIEQKYFHKICNRKDQVPLVIMSSFNYTNFLKENSSIFENNSYDEIDCIIGWIFRKRILDLIISFNLSFCGGINVLEGKLFQNGKQLYKYDIIYNDLEFAEKLSIEIGWPILIKIPLNQTFNWLMNFKNDIDDISSSRIGRAVNAFTYLFHNSYDIIDLSDLLWSLVGLESIYTDGNTDLQNQLDYKSQLLLGERKEFKKVIKKMYEYRSKYVHGKLNFASHFSDKDTTEYFDKFFPEMLESTNTAIGAFVATLQYFVKNDITDINYLQTYNYEITTSKIIKANLSN